MTIPKNLCGFQVLLVETDKKSLQHHAYVLLQNSYIVTSTMKISEALSMIINGKKFDCVLVDAENRDMDLVDFLHTIWINQPQLRVIVMTSNESHMELGRENLANDVIWFLRKPCGVSSICNILQHVCTNRSPFDEGTSSRKSLEENHKCKIVQKADTLHPSTIFNITMINNNAATSNGNHQGLNINSQTYGATSKPVSYVDISSDDDGEATRKKYNYTGTTKYKNKGKQPMDLKRKNELPTEDRVNRQKRKGINIPFAWNHAVKGKFRETSTSLGKEGAYPKTILNHKNIPAIDRAHVASHSQRLQQRENFSMQPRAVGQKQTGISFQVENYASKRSGLSAPSDNNPSNNTFLRAFDNNHTGISYMTFEKIIARLEGGPQPLPQQSTTTINNFAGDQPIKSGDQFQPLIGDTSMSGNFVRGTAANEGLAPLDRFGIPIESCVTVSGDRVEASLNVGLDDLTFPEDISHDLGGVCHPQEFQGNGENLLDIESSDIDNFWHLSTNSLNIPSMSGVENTNEAQTQQPFGNSIVPLDGSEGRIIDNDWYLKLIHDYELEDLVFSNNI